MPALFRYFHEVCCAGQKIKKKAQKRKITPKWTQQMKKTQKRKISLKKKFSNKENITQKSA